MLERNSGRDPGNAEGVILRRLVRGGLRDEVSLSRALKQVRKYHMPA